MEKSHGQGPACDAVEAQYKSLPCKLEPIPGSSRVYAAVRLLLLRTHAPTHGYWRLKLRQLFAYQPKAGADALPPDGLGVKLCLGPEPHDHKDDRNSHSNSSSDSSSSNSSSNSSSDSSSDSSSSNSSSDSGSSNSDSNSSSESVSKGSSSGSTFFGGSGVSLLGSRMLWHGSRLTNIGSIISRGLHVAPAEAPSTGYMFDKGIYFADLASKSSQYCFASASQPLGVLLICDVALGRPYKRIEADADAKRNAQEAGRDCTWGVGKAGPSPAKQLAFVLQPGKRPVKAAAGPLTSNGELIKQLMVDPSVGRQASLLYNEFVVYNPNQVKIRFVACVEFEYKNYEEEDDEQDDGREADELERMLLMKQQDGGEADAVKEKAEEMIGGGGV
eukprot:GHVT01072712.1.p1 GENE.GHVT01072712.1~~GHVT01072712.1.p1  ORF type:complete len:388 (-),score=130.67 GHVT01072712.1:211-1374(-)